MKLNPNSHRGALTLLAALILASLAGPAAADHGRDGVTLFRDVHFKGRYETFDGDIPNLRGTYIGNDRASSIAVPRGCRVTLFQNAGYRGRSITVRHDIPDLRGSRVGNDEVSSLSVDCHRGGRYGGYDHGYGGGGHYGGGYDDDGYGGGRVCDAHDRMHGVVVFSNAGFQGRSERFDYDDPDLRNNRIRQDTISSIHVSPGCRAVLFEDVGFRGAATVVTRDAYSLRHSRVGNDRVSSIQVDCRRY